MKNFSGNIFSQLPRKNTEEVFHDLLKSDSTHLERIVSFGQKTPPGEWLTQDHHEWVMVLQGQACLLIQGCDDAYRMSPGDYLLIPRGQAHRVEWTDPHQETIWLALHYL